MILAPTSRERERWYAILLLAKTSVTAAVTAEALSRDLQAIGRWASAFGEREGLRPLIFEQTVGSTPPRSTRRSRKRVERGGGGTARHLRASPWLTGIGPWPRPFVSERFGISLRRSRCRNWLHRLGIAFKRPKKQLLKAEESQAAGLRDGLRSPVGRGPTVVEPGYSLPMRPIFRAGRRNCGASGCSRVSLRW